MSLLSPRIPGGVIGTAERWASPVAYRSSHGSGANYSHEELKHGRACPFHNRGCDFSASVYQELTEHAQVCPHRHVPCAFQRNGCTTCPIFGEFAAHCNSCVFRDRPCPFSPLGCKFRARIHSDIDGPSLSGHLSMCLARRACLCSGAPYGCPTLVIDDLEHIHTGMTLRAAHEPKCGYVPVSCRHALRGCTERMPRMLEPDHANIFCSAREKDKMLRTRTNTSGKTRTSHESRTYAESTPVRDSDVLRELLHPRVTFQHSSTSSVDMFVVDPNFHSPYILALKGLIRNCPYCEEKLVTEAHVEECDLWWRSQEEKLALAREVNSRMPDILKGISPECADLLAHWKTVVEAVE